MLRTDKIFERAHLRYYNNSFRFIHFLGLHDNVVDNQGLRAITVNDENKFPVRKVGRHLGYR